MEAGSLVKKGGMTNSIECFAEVEGYEVDICRNFHLSLNFKTKKKSLIIFIPVFLPVHYEFKMIN